MSDDAYFMKRVLDLAKDNVAKGGWPFATVIIKDGAILAEGVNGVHQSHDPSDHAEIAAIRKASAALKTPDLSGCTLYLVGLPCPMCMTCILLAKISRVVYAVGTDDKDKALTKLPTTEGLYNDLAKPFEKMGPTIDHLDSFSEFGVTLFKKWNESL